MSKEQDVLFEQYKIIHEATQAAHKYAWQMTSIFVPVVGAGVVFALGQPFHRNWAGLALKEANAARFLG